MGVLEQFFPRRSLFGTRSLTVGAGVAGCHIDAQAGERALFLVQSTKEVWFDVFLTSAVDTEFWIRGNVVDLGWGPGGASNPYDTIEIPLDIQCFYGTNAAPGLPNPPAVSKWTAGTTTLPAPAPFYGSFYAAGRQAITLPTLYCPPDGYTYVACYDVAVACDFCAIFFEKT